MPDAALRKRTLLAAAGAQDASDLDWGGTRVLVAEDDPVNQLVVQTMLENLGGTLRSLRMVRKPSIKARWTPSTILMDLQYSYGWAGDRADPLRQDPTPIIALTANILPETMPNALNGYGRLSVETDGMEDLEMHGPRYGVSLNKWASPAKVRIRRPEEAAHTVLDEALSQQRGTRAVLSR